MSKSLPIYHYPKNCSCRSLVHGAETGQIRFEALVRERYPGKRLARSALPGVKTLGFWDAEHEQDWGLDWHCDPGIELTFLETGRLGYGVDGQNYELDVNSLTFTRPWQRHRVGRPNVTAGRLYWLLLDIGADRPHQSWKWPSWLLLTKKDREELSKLLQHTEQAVWNGGTEIRRCFGQIGRAIESDRDGGDTSRLTLHLNELFLLVLELLRDNHAPLDASLATTRRTVELFWNDLKENLKCLALPWTLASMAKQCGLGTTHFTRHTKDLTNITPTVYLNRCRVEAAAQLLSEEPRRSVTDIAMQTGFSSSQYFATVFRQNFHCSPRQFRAEASGAVSPYSPSQGSMDSENAEDSARHGSIS